MNPALVGLVIEFALKYGLPAAREIVALLHNPAPSIADWDKMFDAAETNAKLFLDSTAPK